LEAYMYDGRLYYLPLAFHLELIGVNAQLPERWAVETFEDADRITMAEVLALYNEMLPHIERVNAHPGRYFTGRRNGNFVVGATGIPWFTGVATHAVNHAQGDALVQMMAHLSYAQVPDLESVLPRPLARHQPFMGIGDELYYSTQAMFMSTFHPHPHQTPNRNHAAAPGLSIMQALMGTAQHRFGHFVPLAAPDGRLAAHPNPSGLMGIHADGNVDMAFRLLLRLPARTVADHSANRSLGHIPVPILRTDLAAHLHSAFSFAINEADARIRAPLPAHMSQNQSDLWRDDQEANLPPRDEWGPYISSAALRMYMLLQEPLVMTFPLPAVAYRDAIDGLLGGTLTPEQAAYALESHAAQRR